MREYNKEEYSKKMEKVYGKSVVHNFKKFEHRKNPHFPETYEEFKRRLERYVSRIDYIDEEDNENQSKNIVLNFNTHRHFARFILISIEKCNKKLNTNLSKKKQNANQWETEHILAQANKENVENNYIRSLGNLTLISQELNVKSSNAPYKTKRKLFRACKGEERGFHLNKFYRRKTFKEKDVDKRYRRLKNKFINIFYDYNPGNTVHSENDSNPKKTFSLDKFEEIIGIRKREIL